MDERMMEERTARARGLRGMVIHLVPRAERLCRNGVPTGRTILVNAHQLGRAPQGRCVWCRQPVDGRRRRWHISCVRWFRISIGRYDTPIAHGWLQPVVPKGPCPCGEPGAELDHIVPCRLAARQGKRPFVRAFLPENLQWLCRGCHKRKTAADRRAMAQLDRYWSRCPICRREFRRRRTTKQYCSNNCRLKATRLRQERDQLLQRLKVIDQIIGS